MLTNTRGQGLLVSIHALTRSATTTDNYSMTSTLFQSTHSRGVRHQQLNHKNLNQQFQSTHSRGVRQIPCVSKSSKGTVSIHALTRSATGATPEAVQAVQVSIHALTRSATWPIPRPRPLRSVSIHALTRSATKPSQASGEGDTGFNPRTHEECDRNSRLFISMSFLFQSTHSRGVRLVSIRIFRRLSPFQSTHSRGVRRCGSKAIYGWAVSIHALTRSATFVFFNLYGLRDCFNPRTHEECDTALW